MKTKFFYGMTALATLGLAACTSEDLPVDNGKQETPDGDKSYYINVAIHGDMPGTRSAGTDGNPTNGEPIDDDNNNPTDFENGTGTESVVSNAYFVFYDADGNRVGNVVQVDLGQPTPATNPNGTVENYYYKVVRVDKYTGQGTPAQVMCYVNPITPTDLQNPLNTIETVTRKEVTFQGQYTETTTVDGTTTTTTKTGSLFPMSNSVYYTANSDASTPQIAAPIDEAQIFESEAEAQKAAADATSTSVIDIYVERYASKLTFNTSEVTPYTTNTWKEDGNSINQSVPVSLTFNIQGWALNGVAKETYAVKSFRQETTDGQLLPDNYTYKLLNDRINAQNRPWAPPATEDTPGSIILNPALVQTGAWVWNNPAYHRSYWAISPAYFQGSYPQVANDLYKKNEDGSLVLVDGKKQLTDSPQEYLSYNQILGVGEDKKGFTEIDDRNGKNSHYFRETTVGVRALASKNPAAAVASVVLLGNYTISVNGTALTDNTGFYTYVTNAEGKPTVFFEDESTSTVPSAESKVEGGMSMFKRFLLQQTVLYKNIAAEGQKPEYVKYDANNAQDLAKLVAITKVDRPSEGVKGKLVLADRQFTLQIQPASADAYSNIYIPNGDGYKALVTTVSTDAETAKNQISLTDANRILMDQVGYAVYYNAGKGFFNIPVKHTGWYRASNTQKDAAKINWNIVRVGDFGMVRNHTYSINVTEIKGLAAGIADVTVPIVPPADTQDLYMAYRVRILKWAIVPTQNVKL